MVTSLKGPSQVFRGYMGHVTQTTSLRFHTSVLLALGFLETEVALSWH